MNGVYALSNTNEVIQDIAGAEPAGVGLTVLMIVFYLVFPAITIMINRHVEFMKRIDSLLLCYAGGIIIGNIGILPDSFFSTQNWMTTLTVPIALPLIFFSMDIKKWARLAKKSLLSLLFQTLSIVIVSIAGFFIFRNLIGEETYQLSGMFVGVYTGGTVNLASIKTALGIEPSLYVAAQAADIVVSTVYILFCLTIAQKLFLKFLPRFESAEHESEHIDLQTEVTDFNDYTGIFSKAVFPKLLAGFGLAVLIFGVGGGISMLLPAGISDVVAILLITSLGIAASFVPKIRNIPHTFQLGHYFILIFCVVVGSMADLREIFTDALPLLLYVTYTVIASVTLHLIFARIFKIDADTVIITSTAGINSPPMVPMIAAALKNKEVIITGVLTGIIGWVVGTYLGIGISYFLKMF